MNIINVDSVKRITGTNNKVSVSIDRYGKEDTKSAIVILNDDDVNNENCLIKLRGTVINGLLLPKKYKFTFNSLPIATTIQPHLNSETVISYY